MGWGGAPGTQGCASALAGGPAAAASGEKNRKGARVARERQTRRAGAPLRPLRPGGSPPDAPDERRGTSRGRGRALPSEGEAGGRRRGSAPCSTRQNACDAVLDYQGMICSRRCRNMEGSSPATGVIPVPLVSFIS